MTISDSARRARLRRGFLIANGVAAAAVSAGLMALLAIGTGRTPALGTFLVPGHGGWAWQLLLIPVGHGGMLP